MAHLAKQQVSVQNAFRWLHVNMDTRRNKVRWLTVDVKVYGGREVLNLLATQGSQKVS